MFRPGVGANDLNRRRTPACLSKTFWMADVLSRLRARRLVLLDAVLLARAEIEEADDKFAAGDWWAVIENRRYSDTVDYYHRTRRELNAIDKLIDKLTGRKHRKRKP